MIKNVEAWRQWENEFRRNTPIDTQRNIQVFQWMLDHATANGKFPRKNMLDDLDEKINLAKALHVSARPL